ncbi:MAG: response regulator [Spirochaetales bacterium]|nr:response regulator [Spirochaetales bacterium]
MVEINNFFRKEELLQIIEDINCNLHDYIKKIADNLLPIIFDNDYAFNPDTIQEVVELELNTFLIFLKTNEEQIISLHAKESIYSGLNERIIITIYNIFTSLLLEAVLKDKYNLYCYFVNRILFYLSIFINSFLAARATQIHQEQKQLYKTLTNTVTKEREKLLQKEKHLQEAKMRALEEKEREKTDFLINLSHEIKLPLTVIQNALNEAIDQAGRRKLHAHDILKAEINDLQNMIINMLDYEKIKQGKMLYDHAEVINFSNIVKSKAELYCKVAEENKIEITTDIREKLYTRLHPQAADRILNNIIDNAIKYNKTGGAIHIELKENNRSIILTIRDTGIGISKEQLPHLFKPYYQSEFRKKNIQGIGAGLSLVKNVLGEVKGKIAIASKAGEETTVIITLKLKTVTDMDDVVENPYVSGPTNRKHIKLKQETYSEEKKTVLFVEDNIVLVNFLQEHLSRDYNYYYAFNGRDALKKLVVIHKPDIIISDIMMDVMDGYEFFTGLKETDEYKDIPLIFLTAKTTISDKIKGLNSGAVDYIEKPFMIDTLKAKIKALIRDHDIYSARAAASLETRIFTALRTEKNTVTLFERKTAEYNISPREKEVLQYVLKGLSNKEIAEQIFLSVDTIKKHILNIRQKCKAKSKFQLLNIFKV